MAEKTEFLQAIDDAILDADSLERFINGSDSETVLTRLSAEYPTLQKAIKTLFENGGLPATPFATKALMTASALVDGDYAMVTDDTVNNGLYVKSSGVWVKSTYDPLTQSKSYTDTAKTAAISAAATDATTKANAAQTAAITEATAQAKNYYDANTQSIDVSAANGDYDLTLAEAVALVPTDLRKTNLTLKFNGKESYTYVVTSTTAASWTSLVNWHRTSTLNVSGVNGFTPDMVYEGYSFSNFESQVTYSDTRAVIIIPVQRANPDEAVDVNIEFISGYRPPSLVGFNRKTASMSRDGGITGYFYSANLPATVKYITINIARADVDIYKNSLMYHLTGETPLLSNEVDIEHVTTEYGLPLANSLDYRVGKEPTVTNPYFVGGMPSVKGTHITNLVRKVEVIKGSSSLINSVTGEYRKIFVRTAMINKTTKNLSVTLDIESASGVLMFDTLNASPNPIDGYYYLQTRNVRGDGTDDIVVKLEMDGSQLVAGVSYEYGLLASQVHPSLVANAALTPAESFGESLTIYDDVGVAYSTSNMNQGRPDSLVLDKQMRNGVVNYGVAGDTGKSHQQVALVATTTSRFSCDNATLKAGIHLASGDLIPDISVVRDSSGIGMDRGYLEGENPNQWIHPDIAYAPNGVGGYKYWMTSSTFPADTREETELFVGNDGVNWKRVRSSYEGDNNAVGFTLPPVYWEDWESTKKGFIPIPKTGVTLEFATDTGTSNQTITRFLQHDPAITFSNGYVIVYLLFNLGFVQGGKYQHKYIVCMRTNDGVNWEIVREDGTTMPYNEANALKIFSKTGSVRNHHYYKYVVGGTGSTDLSPQVVEGGDGFWYIYTRNSSLDSNLNLVRYKGVSPYDIDYTNPENVMADSTPSGSLWHFGLRQYNGTFYLVTNGYLLTSTDGVNFTSLPNKFFWAGMSTDLYKPAFVLGHDNKVKFVYGFQQIFSLPNPLASVKGRGLMTRDSPSYHDAGNCGMVACEYTSLADMVAKSSSQKSAGYVDLQVFVISKRERSVNTYNFPAQKSNLTFTGVKVSEGDTIYVVAFMNTRGAGKVTFTGVSLYDPARV